MSGGVSANAASAYCPRRAASRLARSMSEPEHVHARRVDRFAAHCGVTMKQNRQRVRLFARRAARAPYVDGTRSPLPEYRDDRSRHRIERRPVPEQLGDVDGQRVEQPLVLHRVPIQQRGVVREPMDAPGSHAHRNAPAETPSPCSSPHPNARSRAIFAVSSAKPASSSWAAAVIRPASRFRDWSARSRSSAPARAPVSSTDWLLRAPAAGTEGSRA